MENQLLKKVRSYSEKNHLIGTNDRILAGVSGGADSVFLFFLLLKLQKELNFQMQVVHVHHGIRQEAEKDLKYVTEICEKNNISCHVFRENIPQLVQQSGMTEEEAGRKVRYDDFRNVLESWKESEPLIPEEHFKIATAHHMGDQAETVLFQLFRGSGLTGLCGIRPEKDKVIRPLLCLTKKEIEKELYNNHIFFCLDETNLNDNYARNKIRHRILPYAEQEVCSGAAEHIAHTAEILQEAEHFIQNAVENSYHTVCRREKEILQIQISELEKLDPFLMKEVLLRALSEISRGRKDITSHHIEEIRKLLGSGKNAVLSMPYKITAERIYEDLYLYQGGEHAENQILLIYCREKNIPQEFFAAEQPRLNVKQMDFVDKNKSERYTQYFDYDKINSDLTVRHRNTGDYIFINSEGQKKSLKEFMIENRIPRNFRDQLWLVADESHILWIPGFRVSGGCKVTSETRHMVKVWLC